MTRVISNSLQVLLLATLLGCSARPPILLASGASPLPALPSPTPFQKIFVIVLENEDASEALKQPFLRELTNKGALLTQFGFEARPSQPNYLAMTSGSTHGITTNENVNLDVRHIGNLLEEKGKTWKSYAEDYPGNCFKGPKSSAGIYVRKHEPFISYNNVQSDPARCRRVVNARELDEDIKNHSLPDFSLFIPNNEHNGHSPKDVAFADNWLRETFKDRLRDPDFMTGMLFIVTFDECNARHSVPVYTVLVGDSVRPGAASDFPYNHYSLLRTIEDAFELGTLGQEDAKAVPIGGIWK